MHCNLVILVMAAALIAGCGTKEPVPAFPTVPVRGKVEFTKGGAAKSLADRQAMVEFESVEQPGTKAFGEIQDDGSFSLRTNKEGQWKDGAVEGTHRVRINIEEGSANLVNSRFLRYDTSGITIKVPS